MPLRVLSVIGTRPEAVKMAPVVKLLENTYGVESHLCVTAQHRQMLDQVLNLFGLVPDFDLDLMREDQPLADLSASIFANLDPIVSKLNPDWILVQGDTTTVAITALLAYYRRIKVGHVEAGLRTHDKWQPFPEEINRRVAGVIADLHFAPTDWARRNLLREGVAENTVIVTGNPVIDALKYVADQPEPVEVIHLLNELRITDPKSDQASALRSPSTSHYPLTVARKLILVTAHRRENFGQPLENICLALKGLASRGDVELVYPVHLNPNVQEPVKRLLHNIPHIRLLPPLDYLPLVHLMKHSRLILTDSGGIQEEAPAFGIPALVLRDVTERPEGVEAGVLKLVGTDPDTILNESRRLLDDESAYAAMAKAANPYGDGHAAERIVQSLLSI